jgi:hypothetical protein
MVAGKWGEHLKRLLVTWVSGAAELEYGRKGGVVKDQLIGSLYWGHNNASSFRAKHIQLTVKALHHIARFYSNLMTLSNNCPTKKWRQIPHTIYRVTRKNDNFE